MEFKDIRKNAIIAIFSDDLFLGKLVLKGGNAISLVHRLDYRTSLDLDFSISGDFPDLPEAEARLFAALKRHFETLGHIVFDEKLAPKPTINTAEDSRPWWGGYELTFKLTTKEKYHRLRNSPERLRIQSLTVGGNQERTFTVDISKCEYTDSKTVIDFESYSIPVYTVEMIVAEKLRALCQQMPEYEYGTKGRAKKRARDFYDIHVLTTKRCVDLSTAENRILIANIFQAKKVPLALMSNLSRHREFHREDWPAVVNTIGEDTHGFDFYFDHTWAIVLQLQSFWEVDPPS